MGCNRVIHLQGPWKNKGDRPTCNSCGYQPPKKGGVVKSCLDCFLRGQSLVTLEYKIRIPWENLDDTVSNTLNGGTAIQAYGSKKFYLRLYKEGNLYGHLKISGTKSSDIGIDHEVRYYKYSSAKSPHRVMETAEELCKDSFHKYNLVIRNCEDFATYCTTGDPRSTQVEKFCGFFGVGQLLYRSLKCLHRLNQKRKKRRKLHKRLAENSSNTPDAALGSCT